MKRELLIIIEYKVKEDFIELYERSMKEILLTLPDFGVKNIQWFASPDVKNQYIEMYEVPTISHHHALKKFRLTKNHEVFGKIESFLENGYESVNYWALKSLKRDKNIKLRYHKGNSLFFNHVNG